MLRTTLVFAFTLMAATAQAQTWIGGAVIDKVTPTCSQNNINAGNQMSARFRAPNLFGNGNNYGFSFFTLTSAQTYGVDGSTPLKKEVSVFGGYIFGGMGTLPGSTTLKILKLSPLPVKESTEFVNIEVWIGDYQGIVGCDATIRASVTFRP